MSRQEDAIIARQSPFYAPRSHAVDSLSQEVTDIDAIMRAMQLLALDIWFDAGDFATQACAVIAIWTKKY
jgi:hypothetical protein